MTGAHADIDIDIDIDTHTHTHTHTHTRTHARTHARPHTLNNTHKSSDRTAWLHRLAPARVPKRVVKDAALAKDQPQACHPYPATGPSGVTCCP